MKLCHTGAAITLASRFCAIGLKSALPNQKALAMAGVVAAVSLLGDDISDLGAHQRARRGLGRTFQAARLFPELAAITGDIGARELIAAHPELVADVEMESDGVLTDIDTPQALAKLAATAKIEA